MNGSTWKTIKHFDGAKELVFTGRFFDARATQILPRGPYTVTLRDKANTILATAPRTFLSTDGARNAAKRLASNYLKFDRAVLRGLA
jgi:hypothetical protein